MAPSYAGKERGEIPFWTYYGRNSPEGGETPSSRPRRADAAVDHDLGAGDVARLVRGEEEHRVSRVPRVGHAAITSALHGQLAVVPVDHTALEVEHAVEAEPFE